MAYEPQLLCYANHLYWGLGLVFNTREELKGTTSMEYMNFCKFCGFLQFFSTFCSFLRFSATICASQVLQRLGTAKSAKICEFGSISPF